MSQSISEYLHRKPASSKEIQAETGLNQATVSRQLRKLGDKIIKLQSGRTPRYALSCSAFGADDRLPLMMINAEGNRVLVANLRPLAHGGFFVEPATEMPPIFLGERGNGLYDDLPYFLSDLCPQGFIGRQIAQVLATQSDQFPADPRHWNSNQIGRYLISNGEDLPSNLQFGQPALCRLHHKPLSHEEHDYPELANAAISGLLPGSSAGGEQPKFTAFLGSRMTHVMVKFSPLGASELTSRWRDILITEFHATQALRDAGIPAAKTRLIESCGRLFLESKRFDRVAEQGRTAMISLQAIDAEFVGLGSNWPKILQTLHEMQLVSWEDVCHTDFLWNFGRLINNTDMHLGNLSLGIKGKGFKLLPIYDMCSMGFAPKSGGELSPYRFSPPEIPALNLDNKTMLSVKNTARDFWQKVVADERISTAFRNFIEISEIFLR